MQLVGKCDHPQLSDPDWERSLCIDCSSLASVTIPDSVTEIGERAFAGCSSLASVTIPDSVTRIKRQAFVGCGSLASVTNPESVTQIGYESV